MWLALVVRRKGRRSGDRLCCWWTTSVCCWVWGSALEPCWTSATTVEPQSALSHRFGISNSRMSSHEWTLIFSIRLLLWKQFKMDQSSLLWLWRQGNMVMLLRCDGEGEETVGDDEGLEWLLKGLTHQCSLSLHVQGLPTGYCRDIHGQVWDWVFLTFLTANNLGLCKHSTFWTSLQQQHMKRNNLFRPPKLSQINWHTGANSLLGQSCCLVFKYHQLRL